MTTLLKPQGRRWTMREVTEFAEQRVAEKSDVYLDGRSAADAAELRIVRALLATGDGRVREHDVEIFRQEIVMAWNRAAKAARTEERYRLSDYIADAQSAEYGVRIG